MPGAAARQRVRRTGDRAGGAQRKQPPRIQVVRDAETVFREAILAGVLSGEPAHRHYAGHYLYLFHDENGTAWFRHRSTRAWVSMTARQCPAAAAGAGL